MANSTNPLPQSLAIPEFTVTQAQIRINVLWFLSLTVSLTTVLVGILCLQWLREFQRDAALPYKDAVALRQMRYEGLMKWHVPGILSILPLLLQLSLVLFFIGLLDLLWSLNTPVAAFVSAVVGMVMLFLTATTTLPALQQALTRDKHLRIPQCPFKSPQSWIFYRAGHWSFCYALRFYLFLINLTMRFNEWGNLGSMSKRILNSLRDNSWLTFDIRWRSHRDAKYLDWWGEPDMLQDSDDVVHGLLWINETFAHTVEAIFPVYHSLAELDIPAAAAMICGFYPFHGETVMFEKMMDDQSSLSEIQKREIITAYYLDWYQHMHPILNTVYVEMVIRILNLQDVPQPCYHWLSKTLRYLASNPLLAPSVTNGAASQLNTDKIIIQTLLCVNKLLIDTNQDRLLNRHMILPEDALLAGTLLRQLLTRPPSPPPNLLHSTHPIDSGPSNFAHGLNLDHIKLAGGLFEAFELWLSREEEEEIDWWEDRVRVCTEGMIRLFSPSIDIAALNAVCPVQMAKAAGLVRALDVHVSRLGGAAAVLERERFGLGYYQERTYEVGEWDSLVSRFEGIEGGDG